MSRQERRCYDDVRNHPTFRGAPEACQGKRPQIAGLHAPIVRDGDGLTETANNSRLRRARYDDWREADAIMDY
jgi:hypothetical protein